MSSITKIESARLNGALGGPKTEQGKKRSSLNGLKHGFCTDIVVLPNEDPEKFERHRLAYQKEFAGTNVTDDLLEQIAAASWRLRRAWCIETAALGEAMREVTPKLEEEFEEFTENVRLYAASTTKPRFSPT